MKLLVCVIFLAVAASATTEEETVKQVYKKLHDNIKEALDKYNSLPNPKSQLEVLNAHSILRLSDHLKSSFKSLREQAIKEKCNGDQICYGSQGYKKGVSMICLHSDNYVANQVDLYENFTDCSDNFLNQIVNNIEIVEKNRLELLNSKEKLEKEFKDKANRGEMIGIIEYYSYIVNDAKETMLGALEKLESLYKYLSKSLNMCAAQGLPRISKDFYQVPSVQNCLNDFLYKRTEPKTDEPVSYYTTANYEQ